MKRFSPAPHTLGLAFAAVAQCLVGASAGISAVLRDYPAAAGQVLRYLVAAAALFGLLRLRRIPLLRPDRRELGLLALLAFAGQTLYTLCMLGAVRYADPATVGSVVGAGPVLLAVAAPLAARRRPVPAALFAAAFVMAGAVTVQGFGHASTTGLLLAAGVAVCEAAVPLAAVPLLPRLGAWRVAAYSTVLAVPQMALVAVVTGHGEAVPMPSAAEAAAILYLGLALTTGAFLLWFASLTRVAAEKASLFMGLVPLAAAVSGVLLGQAGFTAGQLAGAALVGAGIVCGLRAGRRTASASRATPEPLPVAPVVSTPLPALVPAEPLPSGVG